MSQAPSLSHEAALQIHLAATVDGPDRVWPELVPELKPVAVVGDTGHRDIYFKTADGSKIMNVMAPSDICPGAMLYQGTKA